MFGEMVTWKVVYILPPEKQSGGRRGVALVEADSHQWAMKAFMEEYAGQFFTIESCEKLIKD